MSTTTAKDDRPLAFVIMPFGEGFDEIYALFFAETLEEAGYRVERADNSKNAQSILKDIVTSLSTCRLVVADLSDSNPNVYYELGLAHAFRRPVVMLTQSLDDLPFDLRPYRVISYKTHFAEIREARRQLLDRARGLLSGETKFGNPVSDFLPGFVAAGHSGEDESGEGEAGFLDHIVDMEDGFGEMTDVIAKVLKATVEIGDETKLRAEELARANAAGGHGAAARARAILIKHAVKLSEYAKVLRSETERYVARLDRTATAIEAIVQQRGPLTPEDREGLRKFVEQFTAIEGSASGGMDQFIEFKKTIDAIPSAERSMNRARERVSRGLGMFIEAIEKTISSFARVREIAGSRLSE